MAKWFFTKVNLMEEKIVILTKDLYPEYVNSQNSPVKKTTWFKRGRGGKMLERTLPRRVKVLRISPQNDAQQLSLLGMQRRSVMRFLHHLLEPWRRNSADNRAGEGAALLELSLTAGGTRRSCLGNRVAHVYSYTRTNAPAALSWALSLEMWKRPFTQKPVHRCS